MSTKTDHPRSQELPLSNASASGCWELFSVLELLTLFSRHRGYVSSCTYPRCYATCPRILGACHCILPLASGSQTAAVPSSDKSQLSGICRKDSVVEWMTGRYVLFFVICISFPTTDNRWKVSAALVSTKCDSFGQVQTLQSAINMADYATCSCDSSNACTTVPQNSILNVSFID